MKFTKLHGDKIVNVSITPYLIDWTRKVSGPQYKVKQFLFPFWKSHIVLEEYRPSGGLARIDLISLTAKIAIEVSPNKVHLEYNKFFHGGRAGFLKKIKSDFLKREWAERNGFVFIELYDEEIDNLSVKMFKEKFDLDI